MAEMDELLAQLNTLGTELAKRAKVSRKLNHYRDGVCAIPEAVIRAKMTNAYRVLMPMSSAPWGGLIVDSVQDRLEVSGIRSGDESADAALWGIWQDNAMDAESQLATDSALVDGRAFATIWPENGGPPQITLDNAQQVIVQYREGSRRDRVAALRYWMEGERPHATLYRRDGIYKFVGPKNCTGFDGTQWEPRLVPDEDWPLANPYDIVNVVELAVNRRLKAGSWGYARGEFEHCIGLIDRINLLTFLGLVVALWMGFPLRGVLGAKILLDDDEKPIAPFDADADTVFQVEAEHASIAEFKAADRKNLQPVFELTQLAYLTKTPAHYFPLESGLSNVSADTIRALEGGQAAKVKRHKGSLGEGHEEILRVAGLMASPPVELSGRAELVWRDLESRSLAERADAAVKLKDVLPWQALAEKVLSATQEEVTRWEAMRAADPLTALLEAARTAPPAPEPT